MSHSLRIPFVPSHVENEGKLNLNVFFVFLCLQRYIKWHLIFGLQPESRADYHVKLNAVTRCQKVNAFSEMDPESFFLFVCFSWLWFHEGLNGLMRKCLIQAALLFYISKIHCCAFLALRHKSKCRNCTYSNVCVVMLVAILEKKKQKNGKYTESSGNCSWNKNRSALFFKNLLFKQRRYYKWVVWSDLYSSISAFAAKIKEKITDTFYSIILS